MNRSYTERARVSLNSAGRTLLELMDKKQTNLCVACDLTLQEEVLQMADLIGSEICLFKTHVDIIEDFSPEFASRLKYLSQKHNFLIFEDRKFADIGNTVKMQYQGGMYHICDWAHITNAHPLPGPGIIEGLKKVGLQMGRGLLLLAEMSSKGNLASGDYTNKTVEWAKEHDDFVMGFICRRKLTEDPAMIHCTPGVQLVEKGDQLGQQYLTPYHVIYELESDMIIVGRGITEAQNPLEMAKIYRQEGFNAYKKRLSTY